jgi:hypothetical protein
MPTAEITRSIYVRDGWRCRFCGIRVLSPKARSWLRKRFPEESHWDGGEYKRHSGLYALVASLDHVVPHGRGGKNDVSNFVTACFCCQHGRQQFTLEEVEIADPRDFAPIVDDWDGLSRLEGKSL